MKKTKFKTFFANSPIDLQFLQLEDFLNESQTIFDNEEKTSGRTITREYIDLKVVGQGYFILCYNEITKNFTFNNNKGFKKIRGKDLIHNA